MRSTITILSLLCLAVLAPSLTSLAQETPTSKPAVKSTPPLSADTLLKAAVKKAKPHGKKGLEKRVFVIFHASWCGWCKRLEAVLEEEDVRKVMETHYNFVRLDVQENEKKRSLENPGGGRVLEELGGTKAGLPFYAILDANGKKISDSLRMPKEANIGYPGSAEEIEAFENILKETAPKMTESERKVVIDAFNKNMPKAR
ncbi:MAG: thioredoxin family protein [Armatimonadetes bacterium]|nr:thioredoxin family protein [Armatimonadota bacterium]